MTDPLVWWRNNEERFPKLSKLARKYLAIPATEVSSERVFSAAGLTLTTLRNRLDPDTVDQCLFLHKNYSFEQPLPEAPVPVPVLVPDHPDAAEPPCKKIVLDATAADGSPALPKKPLKDEQD